MILGGQQDVGYKGVATGRGALNLCSPPETEISNIYFIDLFLIPGYLSQMLKIYFLR